MYKANKHIADAATMFFHFRYTNLANKFHVTPATVQRWKTTKCVPAMVVYCYEREVMQLELAESREAVYVFQQLV